MTILAIIGFGILMGIVFGFLLEKSRVFEPGIIIGQFQLRNFTMLKVFLTAIITSTIVFTIFVSIGFERLNWKVAIFGADIVGGLLLGIGIALAGACPGTVFAQIGAGYKDSFATLLGGLCGAFAYLQLGPWFKKAFLNGNPGKKITLDTLLDMPLLTTAIIMIIVFALILLGLEWYHPWHKDVAEKLDGLDEKR